MAGSTGAWGWKTDGKGGAGSPLYPGLDPAGTLPAPTTPMAAGTWKKRGTCRAPKGIFYWRGTERLTFDRVGQLWAIEGAPNLDTASSLWRWDANAGFFWDLTPCPTDNTFPPFQYNSALGFNPSTDQLIAIGGPSSVPDESFGTWSRTVDGGPWSIVAAGGPWQGNGQREWENSSLVYDPNRLVMVSTLYPFSELRPGALRWSVLVPTDGSVGPRSFGPAGYDQDRGTFLMVIPDLGMATWEYAIAGQTWTNRTPSTPLAAADDLALWWNPTSKRNGLLTLNNGLTNPTVSVWTWEPGKGEWTAETPTTPTAPAAVAAIQAVAFDVTRGRLVVDFEHGQGAPADTTLWAWDIATRRWTRLSPERWPALWPPLMGQSTVYDPVHKKTVFVGSDYDQPPRLLDWDGVSPTFLEHLPQPGAAWPPALSSLTSAYDRDRRRLVVCGLAPVDIVTTWEWDADTATWTDLKPLTKPGAYPSCTSDSSMAYDAARRRILIWDGQTHWFWQLDPTVGAWERIPLPSDVASLLAEKRTTLVYDERRARAVIATSRLDIVEWDGTAWTVKPNPGTREDGAIVSAYDPRHGRAFFGVLGAPRQLFAWNGTSLSDVTAGFASVSVTAENRTNRLIYDLVGGNLVLIGPPTDPPGHPGATGMSVWEGGLGI